MLLKWLLQTALGATLGAIGLFLLVATRRRARVPPFWPRLFAALAVTLLGVGVTSYVLFTALLSSPRVESNPRAWEYLAGQTIKAAGIMSLAYVIARYMPPRRKDREKG